MNFEKIFVGVMCFLPNEIWIWNESEMNLFKIDRCRRWKEFVENWNWKKNRFVCFYESFFLVEIDLNLEF